MQKVFPPKDINIPTQKLEELKAEAKKYAEIIKKVYYDFYRLGGEGLLVYSISEYESVWGEAYLYINDKWAFFDSAHPDGSWVIKVTAKGILEALKWAYLCENHQLEGGWDIAVTHFRNWMAKEEKRLKNKN